MPLVVMFFEGPLPIADARGRAEHSDQRLLRFALSDLCRVKTVRGEKTAMPIRHVAFLVVVQTLAIAGCGPSPEPIPRSIPEGITVTRDLVYASYDDDRSLMLDLYRPSSSKAAALPGIVVIRGGGWQEGDKEAFGPMAAALAKRGFVAVSIEYRASGERLFPAAVEDTKAAVRWLRANAARYGVNPDAIGAIGGSAGAHLAVYLGVTSDMGELEGHGGNQSYSSTLSAVVGLATPTDFETYRSVEPPYDRVGAFLGAAYDQDSDLWRTASPIYHVDASSPPVLLIHSESDSVVPFEESVRLARAYAAVDVPAELVQIPDAPHAFWNFTTWFEDTIDRAADFFERYLAE